MTCRRKWYATVPIVLLLLTPARAGAQDAIPAPIDMAAVVYTLRHMPPEELIRLAWAGTGQADRAVAIARRESGLRCDAANPRSSAVGLMQTLDIHRARAERLGLSWADIEAGDCLSQVILAFDLWEEQGWRPWAL